jgi:hypothetical protein
LVGFQAFVDALDDDADVIDSARHQVRNLVHPAFC